MKQMKKIKEDHKEIKGIIPFDWAIPSTERAKYCVIPAPTSSTVESSLLDDVDDDETYKLF